MKYFNPVASVSLLTVILISLFTTTSLSSLSRAALSGSVPHPKKQNNNKNIKNISSSGYMYFSKKELNYLPELLLEDEQILCFSSGMMDDKTWLLALTDKRIILIIIISIK